MPIAQPVSCLRCRQPLPEGSHFCVGCGMNNDGALLNQIVGVGDQIQKRRDRLAFWDAITSMLHFSRFFR